MLRFLPDSWLEVLLRPFLLADSVAGLYTEIHAPDWRFLLLGLLFLVAAMLPRQQSVLPRAQGRAVIGLVLCFYVWTLASGNGRYFFWGLLLVGPLVVAAARRLPASRTMRNIVLVGTLALQGWVVTMTYEQNVWMVRPWTKGPGVARSMSDIASRPAVFLTVDAISHSVLVPVMHAQSRWSNVSGQQELTPGMREYGQLQNLLASVLPKYGIIRAARSVMTGDHQPTEGAWAVIRRAFRSQGLVPLPKPCVFLQSNFGGQSFELQTTQETERGFWFCEMVVASVQSDTASHSDFRAPELDDVFAEVERRCPRFFPAGNGLTRPADGGVVRHYSQSDTSLSINQAGAVYFKNMRAMNPTELGGVDDIRAGRFHLDCSRLPGRYQPPWKRGWGIDLE